MTIREILVYSYSSLSKIEKWFLDNKGFWGNRTDGPFFSKALIQ